MEEGNENLGALSSENKKLSDDIRDLMCQLSEGAKNAHEAEKTKKRLELEKAELVAALEESERAVANGEAKVYFILTNQPYFLYNQ